MKKNMGNIDKVVRLLVAMLMTALVYMEAVTGVLAIVLLVLAGVFTLTSMISVCPLYLPFGLSTCRLEAKEEKD